MLVSGVENRGTRVCQEAVYEMREGPSQPGCRTRLQTAVELLWSRARVVSVKGKGTDNVSGKSRKDERKRTGR